MKAAVTGKGGTGKTTLSGILAHLFRKDGYKVLAVDADPDANLAFALGIPQKIIKNILPISQHHQLIEERTGAKPGEFGQIFKLNPTVNDIADKYGIDHSGIKLLVMGGIQKGGAGCACPENVLLRNILADIMLNRDEVVIVDMEAGVEHLGRATLKAIDLLLITVEPGSASINTAMTIQKLAKELGITNFGIIGNKIHNNNQKNWIYNQFPKNLILGMIPFHTSIQKSDLLGQSLFKIMETSLRKEYEKIYQAVKNYGNKRTLPETL